MSITRHSTLVHSAVWYALERLQKTLTPDQGLEFITVVIPGDADSTSDCYALLGDHEIEDSYTGYGFIGYAFTYDQLDLVCDKIAYEINECIIDCNKISV